MFKSKNSLRLPTETHKMALDTDKTITFFHFKKKIILGEELLLVSGQS